MDKTKKNTAKILSLFLSIRESLEFFATKYNLTVTEMGILFDLSFNQPMSLKQVCINNGLPKSSVSRIIDNLVVRGFVIRKTPPENRRTVQLYLSSEYEKLMETLKDDDSYKDFFLKEVSPEKSERVIALLEELTSLLNEK